MLNEPVKDKHIKNIQGIDFELLEGQWFGEYLGHKLRIWKTKYYFIWSACKDGAFPPCLGGICFLTLQKSVAFAIKWLDKIQAPPIDDDDDDDDDELIF